ncbi:MAG: arsenate reductase ArsC [Elusimicrobia bacterium]|nr:arsenate reductase ArsC [Elusimicrobiota bacterium]
MAEGWARALKAGPIEAYSAGVEPEGVHPLAVKVMAEAGVDISSQRSKHVRVLKDFHYDFVVTVCDNARQACPHFPIKTKIVHAGFEDPAEAKGTEEERLAVFRRVRDQIRAFIGDMPDNLTRKGPP